MGNTGNWEDSFVVSLGGAHHRLRGSPQEPGLGKVPRSLPLAPRPQRTEGSRARSLPHIRNLTSSESLPPEFEDGRLAATHEKLVILRLAQLYSRFFEMTDTGRPHAKTVAAYIMHIHELSSSAYAPRRSRMTSLQSSLGRRYSRAPMKIPSSSTVSKGLSRTYHLTSFLPTFCTVKMRPQRKWQSSSARRRTS